MTHSLHRKGDNIESSDDFVMLVMAGPDRIRKEDVRARMREAWDILARHQANLANYGTLRGGGRHRKPIEDFKQENPWLFQAVFSSRAALQACLQEIKCRNLGISVAVSGCNPDVENICTELDLQPHTVQYSLGIHGKTEKLPAEDVLSIATMCGHAMVSSNLITHLVEQVGKGKMTHAQAAEKLSEMCDCGVFNKHKAERILRKMV